MNQTPAVRAESVFQLSPAVRCAVGWMLLLAMSGVTLAAPLAERVQQAEKRPLAQLIPLVSPIMDENLGQVRRAVLELQDAAQRENRPAFLILEIPSGSSQFHNCYALADFLTAEPLTNVTTVAWVPKTVTGNNGLVALACNEIVLAPDASLGDLGSGKALPADQQKIVQSIVARRRNPKVNEALARSFSDPSVELVRLTVESDGQSREARILTAEEGRQLRESGAVIADAKVLHESGTPLTLSGAQARNLDILAVHTATSRRDLIDHYGLPVGALRELSPAEPSGKVAYIQLHDMIDEVFAAFAQRQIERAVQSGTKLIIFEIDSPGGYLWVCEDLSRTIAALSQRDIKTVAYIPREAYSGGAILAVGCDEIYMQPQATIGNAIPINMMGGIVLRAEEKALSSELKLLRELADAKNRPAALLEKFADKDLEVFRATDKKTGKVWFLSQDEIHRDGDKWEAGPRVPEARPGSALTVSGTRAHELLLAEAPVQDLNELRLRLGIPEGEPLRAIGRTWVDTLVFTLNTSWVTGLLFFVAIVCIYLELMTLSGFFGILSVVAFAIFFWSKMLGGTATGLEVALFMIGMGCLAIELFLIPGFGVFGVSGILLVLGSLVMASQTFTGFNLEYDIERLAKPLGTLGVALAGVIAVSVATSRWMNRIPLLKHMVLAPPGDPELANEPRLRPDETGSGEVPIGAQGTTLTILRPAGKARIDGRLVDVVSDGPFIEPNTAVRVVQSSRNRIVVREA
ncbi:NfeD family protein [Planctomicrobium sp. SH664]|uniref:NfeD family protein n=1 Tax=Planctomicrobium sp. SH664 TaxID=3448125 RepID=UPI003F5B36B1